MRKGNAAPRRTGGWREDGGLQAVSGKCTHMGCELRWNGAEASWDCDCHGSRFALDGTVLEGPALGPLGVVRVDGEG